MKQLKLLLFYGNDQLIVIFSLAILGQKYNIFMTLKFRAYSTVLVNIGKNAGN